MLSAAESKAEERVGRACGGLRVLNSYWVAQDAMYKYYECIMVDPHHKVIREDARINWCGSSPPSNVEGLRRSPAGNAVDRAGQQPSSTVASNRRTGNPRRAAPLATVAAPTPPPH